MKFPRFVSGTYDLTLGRPISPESKPHRKIPVVNDMIMADASIRRYLIGYKKNPQIKLEGITETEFETLRDIWESSVEITFYLDSTGSSEGTFLWMGNFELEEVIYVGGSLGLYSGNIELREI